MIEQIEIEEKQDSAEKLAAIQAQGIQTRFWISAPNFNTIRLRINEIVAFCNTIKTNLLNPDDKSFPTTKAVADELTKKASLETVVEFNCSSQTDVNNLNTEGKATVRVVNSIALTGVITSSFKDGQMFIIKNASVGDVNIIHDAPQSLPANRFSILNNQNLTIKSGAWSYFRYSSVRQRMELFSIFGDDKLLSLANAGQVARSVIVLPDGSLTSLPIMEFEVHNDRTDNGYTSLAQVIADYPTVENNVEIRKKGFQVICPFTTPPMILKKCGDGNEHWLKQTTNGLIKLT